MEVGDPRTRRHTRGVTARCHSPVIQTPGAACLACPEGGAPPGPRMMIVVFPCEAWAAFAQVRAGCMACHEAEKVAFMNNQPLFRKTENPK